MCLVAASSCLRQYLLQEKARLHYRYGRWRDARVRRRWMKQERKFRQDLAREAQQEVVWQEGLSPSSEGGEASVVGSVFSSGKNKMEEGEEMKVMFVQSKPTFKGKKAYVRVHWDEEGCETRTEAAEDEGLDGDRCVNDDEEITETGSSAINRNIRKMSDSDTDDEVGRKRAKNEKENDSIDQLEYFVCQDQSCLCTANHKGNSPEGKESVDLTENGPSTCSTSGQSFDSENCQDSPCKRMEQDEWSAFLRNNQNPYYYNRSFLKSSDNVDSSKAVKLLEDIESLGTKSGTSKLTYKCSTTGETFSCLYNTLSRSDHCSNDINIQTQHCNTQTSSCQCPQLHQESIQQQLLQREAESVHQPRNGHSQQPFEPFHFNKQSSERSTKISPISQEEYFHETEETLAVHTEHPVLCVLPISTIQSSPTATASYSPSSHSSVRVPFHYDPLLKQSVPMAVLNPHVTGFSSQRDLSDAAIVVPIRSYSEDVPAPSTSEQSEEDHSTDASLGVLSPQHLSQRLSENALAREAVGGSDTELAQYLADERVALFLQNDEFMHELRANRDFMAALQREYEERVDSSECWEEQGGGGGGESGGRREAEGSGKGGWSKLGAVDDATLRARISTMGKASRKKFAQIARVFSRGGKRSGGSSSSSSCGGGVGATIGAGGRLVGLGGGDGGVMEAAVAREGGAGTDHLLEAAHPLIEDEEDADEDGVMGGVVIGSLVVADLKDELSSISLPTKLSSSPRNAR